VLARSTISQSRIRQRRAVKDGAIGFSKPKPDSRTEASVKGVLETGGGGVSGLMAHQNPHHDWSALFFQTDRISPNGRSRIPV